MWWAPNLPLFNFDIELRKKEKNNCSQGGCKCHFKYIELNCFSSLLHIQWTNRGHLAAKNLWQTLSATTASGTILQTWNKRKTLHNPKMWGIFVKLKIIICVHSCDKNIGHIFCSRNNYVKRAISLLTAHYRI